MVKRIIILFILSALFAIGGCVKEVTTVTIEPPKDTPIDTIRLDALDGVVMDKAGKPIPGIKVTHSQFRILNSGQPWQSESSFFSNEDGAVRATITQEIFRVQRIHLIIEDVDGAANGGPYKTITMDADTLHHTMETLERYLRVRTIHFQVNREKAQ